MRNSWVMLVYNFVFTASNSFIAGLVANNASSISATQSVKQPLFYTDFRVYPNPNTETYINLDFDA